MRMLGLEYEPHLHLNKGGHWEEVPITCLKKVGFTYSLPPLITGPEPDARWVGQFISGRYSHELRRQLTVDVEGRLSLELEHAIRELRR